MAEIEEFCPAPRNHDGDWFAPAPRTHWNDKLVNSMLRSIWKYPEAETETDVCLVDEEASVEQRFRNLADEWSRETSTVSSVTALVSHPKYREIIRLGWEVVPCLLLDLQKKGDFWFPALAEITGIRPFDPSDAGKSKRMAAAWLAWGKKKGLI